MKIILEDKKVIRVGNSLAITIDDKKVKKHNIKDGDILDRVVLEQREEE